jgi:hypothetical protein
MPPVVNHHKQEVCTGFVYVLRLACLLHSSDLDSCVETVEPFGVGAATTVAVTFSVLILMYVFMCAVAQMALWEGL